MNRSLKINNLETIGSVNQGYISVAEYKKSLPFMVNHFIWTCRIPNNTMQGPHVDKQLEKCIFAVSGTMEFELIDQHGAISRYLLDSPKKGLYISPMHRRTIEFSHNAVLLFLTSDVYDTNDYIRSLDEFLKLDG